MTQDQKEILRGDDERDMEQGKQDSGREALKYLSDGMVLGLGTGSTVECFLKMLAVEVASGLKLECVATSKRTEYLAKQMNIPLIKDECIKRNIQVVIDGADEITPDFKMIKGGGGALLREKMVATAAEKMIVIADASKQVPYLGSFPLPVEVLSWGYGITFAHLTDVYKAFALDIGQMPYLRLDRSGEPILTDQENWIVDMPMGKITSVSELAECLDSVPGVLSHGLFLEQADVVIIDGVPLRKL